MKKRILIVFLVCCIVSLIFFGCDSDVPDSDDYSERAAEVYSDCVLKKIDGAVHGFNSENTFGLGGNYDEQVWEHIDEFLNL